MKHVKKRGHIITNITRKNTNEIAETRPIQSGSTIEVKSKKHCQNVYNVLIKGIETSDVFLCNSIDAMHGIYIVVFKTMNLISGFILGLVRSIT